jgi:hypothetical protein
MTSGAPYAGMTRRFWSFSEAAQENGASRVLAGIHFPTAVMAGYEQGDRIGACVFEQLLTPLTTRATTTVARWCRSNRVNSRWAAALHARLD